MITKKRIGVLRGGSNDHYHLSLKKGGDILTHINEFLGDKYQTHDILIDKNHIWHVNGLPITPSELVHRVDLIWNTSHPSLSNILNSLSIPNISTGAFSSAVEASKEILKEQINRLDVKLPRSIILPVYQKDIDGPVNKYAMKKASEIFEKLGAPWTVKTFTPDANMGIHLAKTFPQLVHAIEDGVLHKKSILIEEFITGRVASVHSVPNFRNQKIYTFPLGKTFGHFTDNEKEKLNSIVYDLHHNIGLTHYLKVDFVMNHTGRIYVLGLTSTPNLNEGSHFSEACDLVGAKVHHVVDHIIEGALQK